MLQLKKIRKNIQDDEISFIGGTGNVLYFPLHSPHIGDSIIIFGTVTQKKNALFLFETPNYVKIYCSLFCV